jgi:hypothetical protein
MSSEKKTNEIDREIQSRKARLYKFIDEKSEGRTLMEILKTFGAWKAHGTIGILDMLERRFFVLRVRTQDVNNKVSERFVARGRIKWSI